MNKGIKFLLSKFSLSILWTTAKKYFLVFFSGFFVIYVLISFSSHYYQGARLKNSVDQLQSIYEADAEDQDELKHRNCNKCQNFTSKLNFIRNLTKLFWKIDTNLILAEPRILQNFISHKKYSVINNYYSNFQFNEWLITFLIRKNTISVDSLKEVSPTLICEAAGNLNNFFCQYPNSSFIIFIVLFIVKNDFIKYQPVEQIPRNLRTVLFKNELILGRHAGSIDWYGHYLTQEEIFVPKYFSNFLLQLRYSQYVPCNKTLVNEFVKAFPKEAETNYNFEVKFKNYLKEMKRVTRIAGIPFWTMSGTTLGWLRQCGIIGYTKDIDFGIWASDHSILFKHLLESSSVLKPQWKYGSIDDGYILRAGEHVDLYFIYQEGNNSTWIGTYDSGERTMYRSTFPMFTLCSTEMFYTRILVPCNAEAMVASEYGNDWFQPKENYNYLSDPKNIKLVKKYSVNEWKKIVDVYIT